MAKQLLHKRQFCLCQESPLLARAPLPRRLITDFEEGAHLIPAPRNLPRIRSSTYLLWGHARWAYRKRLVFLPTKGSHMSESCSPRPLLPSPDTQMKQSLVRITFFAMLFVVSVITQLEIVFLLPVPNSQTSVSDRSLTE